MNCQNCNTTIDYRFQTNCAHCETEAGLSPGVLIQAPIEPVNRTAWTKPFVNFLYLLVSSAAGMISGAVVVYFASAFTYIIFASPSGNSSYDCARGNAVAFLSIITGAFLGTIGGSAFAVKNPLCKS